MSATISNNIWEKAERALVRFVNNNSAVGVNESNVYAGHDNGEKRVPHIVCECTSGEPETAGKATGNLICNASITITTKLFVETGEDNSGRFASIMDSLVDRNAANLLSNEEEFFTVLQQPRLIEFTKQVQGDELMSAIIMKLTCCGSVIT